MMKLLFSTDTDSGTITVIDLDATATTPIATIPVGNGPRGAVRFTRTGRGFVTNHAGNTISEIDANTLREAQRITVGVAPIGVSIAPGDRFLIVSNGGDNTVSIVDLESNQEIYQVPVGREPRHPDITPSGDFAYVPISGEDYISKIDLRPLAEGNVRNVREVTRIPTGKGTMPYSAAISPDGRTVIAANNQADFVSIIDTATDQVSSALNVGHKGARGTAYTPDSSVAFVSIENVSEVVAIDLATAQLTARYPVAPGPRGLLFDADTGTVFVSAFDRTSIPNRSGNAVSAVNFGTQTFTSAAGLQPQIMDIQVGAGPCSVSIYKSP
ncbi:YncE family protein [Rubellimicrobium rubrum]|nr:YncE family protein [Rubellimicrobium rubrum]